MADRAVPDVGADPVGPRRRDGAVGGDVGRVVAHPDVRDRRRRDGAGEGLVLAEVAVEHVDEAVPAPEHWVPGRGGFAHAAEAGAAGGKEGADVGAYVAVDDAVTARIEAALEFVREGGERREITEPLLRAPGPRGPVAGEREPGRNPIGRGHIGNPQTWRMVDLRPGRERRARIPRDGRRVSEFRPPLVEALDEGAMPRQEPSGVPRQVRGGELVPFD